MTAYIELVQVDNQYDRLDKTLSWETSIRIFDSVQLRDRYIKVKRISLFEHFPVINNKRYKIISMLSK